MLEIGINWRFIVVEISSTIQKYSRLNLKTAKINIIRADGGVLFFVDLTGN